MGKALHKTHHKKKEELNARTSVHTTAHNHKKRVDRGPEAKGGEQRGMFKRKRRATQWGGASVHMERGLTVPVGWLPRSLHKRRTTIKRRQEALDTSYITYTCVFLV